MSQYHTIAVADLGVDARARFIFRTYAHLSAAIVGFVALEYLFFMTGFAEVLAGALLSVNWLLVLGAFMIVGWLASHTAHSTTSKPLQYLALAGYVGAYAVIFTPLLFVADATAPGAIESAGLITLLGFAGLTAVAFMTRKDFSFLGGMLRWGFVAALLLIVGGVLFGFQLGTFFSVGMIALAGAAILYDTSNVLHHFPEDQHVSAALQLFGSIALMFWYVLSLFLSSE